MRALALLRAVLSIVVQALVKRTIGAVAVFHGMNSVASPEDCPSGTRMRRRCFCRLSKYRYVGSYFTRSLGVFHMIVYCRGRWSTPGVGVDSVGFCRKVPLLAWTVFPGCVDVDRVTGRDACPTIGFDGAWWITKPGLLSWAADLLRARMTVLMSKADFAPSTGPYIGRWIGRLIRSKDLAYWI